MLRRRKASKVSSETHPLDVIVGMSREYPEPIRNLVFDLALDAAGGGIVSNPAALRYLEERRADPGLAVSRALAEFGNGLPLIRASGQGAGLAYHLFVGPLIEAASGNGRTPTRSERDVLDVVFASGRAAATRMSLSLARAVVTEGSVLVLALPGWARLADRPLVAGDWDAAIRAREAVRDRVRQLIANGGDPIPHLGTIFEEAVEAGLTQYEAMAAFERSIAEIQEARDEVIRRMKSGA
jgi:hypothetical protein